MCVCGGGYTFSIYTMVQKAVAFINCHTAKCLLQATLPPDHIQTAHAFLLLLSAHTHIHTHFVSQTSFERGLQAARLTSD